MPCKVTSIYGNSYNKFDKPFWIYVRMGSMECVYHGRKIKIQKHICFVFIFDESCVWRCQKESECDCTISKPMTKE